MATRQLTQVYLDPGQKKALQSQAKKQGANLSEQIRHAIDAYLSGMTLEELEMLDTASKIAADEIEKMSIALDRTNKKLDKTFFALNKMRKQAEA